MKMENKEAVRTFLTIKCLMFFETIRLSRKFPVLTTLTDPSRTQTFEREIQKKELNAQSSVIYKIGLPSRK